MKHAYRALAACVLMLLTLACLPLSPALARESVVGSKHVFSGGIPTVAKEPTPTEAPTPIPTPQPTEVPVSEESPFIGTVVITGSGYHNAMASSTDSTTVFRVHYGERYLCVEETWPGRYGILLPTGEIAYVHTNEDVSSLLRDQMDETTLSYVPSVFGIKTNKKADMYSQPKSNAKSRRYSIQTGIETSFYYPKGSELVAFGITNREGKDWYLMLSRNDGVLETGWMLASDCEVTYGDPEANPIPSWWYD